MNRESDIRTDIVLLGGGHAHVHVLKAFALRPEPGVRLTLVSRDLVTPYSGMLPGVIAGHYDVDEAHIDLVRLAAVTGTRLIHAEAIGLDRDEKRVLLRDRPPIAYDLLSIDVGITPALEAIEGAAQHGIAAKPIGSFLSKLEALRQHCWAPGGPRRIAVIGGGAGGVELLLSVRARLLAELAQDGRDASAMTFALVTDGEILATHNPRVRERFRRILAARGIALHEHSRARAVTADAIELLSGQSIPADAVLVTTGAAAPSWFRETGLALDEGGFLLVGATLQSRGDPDVFGAGDCVTLAASPREKAGVYAVRAGAPLARNLRRRARGERPGDWHPQRRHLALISTGERHAIASRGWLSFAGDWVWTWKERIDRRWMRMYQDMAAMRRRMAKVKVVSGAAEEMRCGGCAAKVGPESLVRALARLAPPLSRDVALGLDAPDDAAMIEAPPSGLLLQSVDFFRAFIDDPYVFGEIAANHALNDVFAMGGEPRHALAIAVVPAGPPAKVEETLFQLLAGARTTLDREQVALVGGHSSEGMELALGFSVTGHVPPGGALRKGGLAAGDALVLTRPLGTGILFAAAMRGEARAGAIAAALVEMRRSNRRAAEILRKHRASAMTDVTGFGLVGHLGEMLRASQTDAEIDVPTVPLYGDALELAKAGQASTLLPANLAHLGLLRGDIDAPAKALLFDPQTSGGLLAGIPGEAAAACLAELRAAGYAEATVIGRVTRPAGGAGQAALTVVGRLA
jgi:selenide,water dikinase